MRRAEQSGSFATLVRKGASEAGAIYITIQRFDGPSALFGPAPQALISDDQPMDRQFEKLADDQSTDEVSKRVEREISFDPDIWVVELECRDIPDLFEIVASE